MNPRNLLKPLKVILTACIMLLSPGAFCADNQTDQLNGLAEDLPDSSRITLLLQLSSELTTSQPAQSFDYAREALTLAEESDDLYHYGLAALAIAKVYTVTGIYDKALEYLLIAIPTFEELEDTAELADCYNDIGQVYMLSGDFVNAAANYKLSLSLNIKLADYVRIVDNYMNMGSNYIQVDSIDKGLDYLVVSLILADSLQLNTKKTELLQQIGNGFAKIGNDEEALQHFYKVLELIGDDEDDLSRSEAMVSIARGYLHMKNYPAALKYAQDGYNLAKNRNFAYIHRDAAQVLSEIHAAQGNYNLAYRYGNEYQQVSDTIMNIERSDQLARLQTLYELNTIEEENARLRNENISNRRRVQVRTLMIIIDSFILIIMVILIIALNRLNNKYKAINKKLSIQSHELEELNDLKDNFFSFVAHNLKNPFNTIMGFANLMNRAADEKDVSKAKRYSGLIFELSSQVQKVLSNLLEWSRMQRRSFESNPERLEMNSLIRDIAEMNNKEAARKDIHLHIHGRGKIHVIADRSMITTVLQNLVANAVSNTPNEGKISIECRKKESWAETSVSDNGVGIPEEKVNRLFQFDFEQGKVGSGDNSGSGMGLIICHEMLVKNGGTINVKSTPGKGSSFTFTLPLAVPAESDQETGDHNGKSISVHMTDELLASEEVISDEARKAISEIVAPLYKEVTKVLSIDNLQQFSEAIIETGDRHKLPLLVNFGDSLAHLTKTHQIDLIIRVLPRFREYLKLVNAI